MKKLLYILPEYRKDAHTHFAYIPAFLGKLSAQMDVLLLVEKGDLPVIPGVQSFRSGLFSILYAHFHGYRTCYVHYSFKGAFMASLIARAFGGKVFYWNCGLPWQYKKSFFRERFERAVYRLVSHLVTGTEGLAGEYARVYGIPRSKILVMPNWIDLSRTPIAHPDAQTVLFAHRLSPRKGAQYLPEIAKKVPDAQFIVIGDGPVKPALENIPNIRLMGWQSHEKVLELMAGSSIFITPSDEEGFPHVLLEAMAIGVPFVATNVGGVSEIVPPALQKMLVHKGDTNAFVAQLKTLLALSPDERAHMVSEMQSWVRKYDSEVVAKRFVELITV